MEENESQRECKLCGVAINETIYKCFFCDTIYCNKCKTKHKHHYFMEIDNFKQYEEEININPRIPGGSWLSNNSWLSNTFKNSNN